MEKKIDCPHCGHCLSVYVAVQIDKGEETLPDMEGLNTNNSKRVKRKVKD